MTIFFLQHAKNIEHDKHWQMIQILRHAFVSDKYFFVKLFWSINNEHVKMKNTDSTCNNDGISRKQAKTTDRTCECTYTEGPSILGNRLLVRVSVIGLDPGPSLQNHWTGRISSA